MESNPRPSHLKSNTHTTRLSGNTERRPFFKYQSLRGADETSAEFYSRFFALAYSLVIQVIIYSQLETLSEGVGRLDKAGDTRIQTVTKSVHRSLCYPMRYGGYKQRDIIRSTKARA